MAVELKGGVKAPDPTPPIYIRILETMIGYCELQGYSTQVLITSTGAIGYDAAAGPDMPLYTYIYDGPGTFLGIGLEGGQTPTYAVGDAVSAATFYSVLGATGYPIVYTPDLVINYKGSQIAETSSSGTKILKTAGKYMEDDVEVVYTRPAAGPDVIPLSVVSNGTYSALSGYAYNPINVNVPGTGWETAPESWATGVIDKTLSGSVYGSMVLKLRDNAFALCHQLSAAYFPECTLISMNAFYECARLSDISFPACTFIGDSAFYSCAFSIASFPACTVVKYNAFGYCLALSIVYFPKCTILESNGFAVCSSLTSVYLPICAQIGVLAFYRCTALSVISLPSCVILSSGAFKSCTSLRSVYLMGSQVVSLYGDVFVSTPLLLSSYLGVFGSIYVPLSLVQKYKYNANWSIYRERIIGVE